ncbi:hypothetical protein BHM03_00052559 [Ensete ventricosum]|nr:hypothetical protein BHM03_00052559 [Ensete ventricosum]
MQESRWSIRKGWGLPYSRRTSSGVPKRPTHRARAGGIPGRLLQRLVAFAPPTPAAHPSSSLTEWGPAVGPKLRITQ